MSRAVNRTTKSGDLEEYSNGRHLKAHKRHFKSSNKKKWLSGTFKVFVFFSIGILLYFLTFIRSLSYLNDLEESISWALHAIHIRGGTPEKTSENIPVKWTYNEAECKPPDWTVEEKVGNVSLGCDEIEKLREEGWKKIGEGYWRDVFLAEWKGKPIVVKYMKEKHKKNERNLDRHQREAITLGILHRSKNVVKLVGYCDYHVATEWMPLNLEEVIFSPRILPYKHVLQIAMGIARSLRDVHKIAGGPVVHADIQPRQFMIDYDGHIKINDLNRCRYMQHDNAGEACPFQIKSHNGRWRSPEEYTEGALLTEKIDIYSVGLIFWSLLSRKLPYNDIRNDKEQQLFVIEGGRPPIDLSWPKEFVKLIKNCWDPEPSNRPQAQTVLNKATKFYEEYSKIQASEDGYEYDYSSGQKQLLPELHHLSRKIKQVSDQELNLASFQIVNMPKEHQSQLVGIAPHKKEPGVVTVQVTKPTDMLPKPAEMLPKPQITTPAAPQPVLVATKVATKAHDLQAANSTVPVAQVEAAPIVIRDRYVGENCTGEPWWKERPQGKLGCHQLETLKNASVKISHGYFRDAYHGKWGTQDFCLKYLRDTQDEHENIRRHRREAVALSKVMGNPNVIQFMGRCHNNIFTEWMPLRLDNLVFKDTTMKLPYKRVLRMALDMAKGLMAFHEVEGGPIAHTDIQLKQFLIDYDGTVKIGDLNRAKFTSHDINGKPCGWTSSINKGRWRSPEEYTPNATLTEKLDIYSLGMSFWSLLSRKKPFSELSSDEVPEKVRDLKLRPPIDPEWRPLEFMELIKDMWHDNPTYRPSAKTVVAQLEQMIVSNTNLTDYDFRYKFESSINETEAKEASARGKELQKQIEAICEGPSWMNDPPESQLTCEEFEQLVKDGEVIGAGYWRDVYISTWKGERIVVKWMKDSHSLSQRNLNRHKREEGVLGQLMGHPNVVQFLGRCDFHIATEWLPLTLDDVLYNEGGRHRHIPYMWKLKIALDAAKGVEALHNLPEGPIAHTDIQARQFLVDWEGTTKINDFNRCRFMTHFNGTECPFYVSINNGNWRAPEEYTAGHPLTEKLDIYSLSLIFWGLLSRREPYYNVYKEENQKSFVIKGGRPKMKQSWPKKFVQLIQDMWEQRPEDRPTASEVVARVTKLLEEHTPTADDLQFKFDYGKYTKDPLIVPKNEVAASQKVQSIDGESCLPTSWWSLEPEGMMGCAAINALKTHGKKIGEGYWRDIVAMNYNSTNIVIKYMKQEHEHNKRNIDRHMRESIALSLTQHHPNVVHFLGRCNYDVVTEWMPFGLDQLAFNKTKVPELSPANIYSLALGVAKGVEAIHTVPGGPIVHADIQTKQFLVDESGTVKINDLNRCRFVPHTASGDPCPFYIYDHGGKWRSPEEYQGDMQPLSEKIDIYSMALVLWSLLSRTDPFPDHDTDQVQQMVIAGERPPLEQGWPKAYTSLIQELWQQDPAQRPSASEAAQRLQVMLVSETSMTSQNQSFDAEGKSRAIQR